MHCQTTSACPIVHLKTSSWKLSCRFVLRIYFLFLVIETIGVSSVDRVINFYFLLTFPSSFTFPRYGAVGSPLPSCFVLFYLKLDFDLTLPCGWWSFCSSNNAPFCFRQTIHFSASATSIKSYFLHSSHIVYHQKLNIIFSFQFSNF